MSNAFISICIPAYKRVEYIKRLLDSIASQRFQDFEVIVTDDSPSEEVHILCSNYEGLFPLQYFKNASAKGTPENWNEAIRHAKGQWIKLMHDDDWFSSPDSLDSFAKAVKENDDRCFFYSAYQNIYEDSSRVEPVHINSFRKKKLEQETATLFSSNVIGPPSVTLVKNDQTVWYDKRMKWLVDIDFYNHYLRNTKPVYINQLLINIGIHKEQVTRIAFRVPAVEIPENFLFLEKTGVHRLANMLVYDAWWRSVRNLFIKDIAFIRENGYTGEIPAVIRSIIRWQRKIPRVILKTGLLSKMFMYIHYLFHRHSLK